MPNAFQSALFGDGSIAFALTFGLLLVAKYGALRWAVGPFLPARTAWLVACMGTVLIPWSAGWRGRYSAAELSAVFLFVALGAVLRNRRGTSPVWILAAARRDRAHAGDLPGARGVRGRPARRGAAGAAVRPRERSEAVRVWARRIAIAWLPVVARRCALRRSTA